MAETIEYEQFEQSAQPDASASSEPDLNRLSEIPMELSVEIGRARMTVGETLELHVGSVVALERQAGDAADLLVNGTAVARGEVVVIDDQYGLRVTEIIDTQQEDGAAAPDGSTEPAQPAQDASPAQPGEG